MLNHRVWLPSFPGPKKKKPQKILSEIHLIESPFSCPCRSKVFQVELFDFENYNLVEAG